MPGGRILRFLLSLAVACLVSALLTWGLGALWLAIGGGAMSIHGWIALGIGSLGTAGLAWGLMALAFRSHRNGWDDQVDNSLDPGRASADDQADRR